MSDAPTLLREVLLGRATWRDLAAAGFDVRAIPGGWAFGPPSGAPMVVTEDDLRHGIAQQAGNPGAREWASFVLCASDLFDLEPLTDSGSVTAANAVEALWDLSFGRARPAG
jgi:hypothetical protein